MAAVTGKLVEAQSTHEPGEEPKSVRLDAQDGALGDLGRPLRALPPVTFSHASLTRTVWIRRLLEQFAAPLRFRVVQAEEGANAGQLVFRFDNAREMPKDVVPWMTATRAWDEFALWGESGKMACVAAGTPILTSRGVLPIEQVRVGDMVLTRDRYVRVRAAQRTGIKPTLRILTQAGWSVRVTHDHLVLARDGWEPGEKPSPSKRSLFEFVRADALDVGMFVHPPPQVGAAPLAEGTERDYREGLLLGYCCGDGSFAENGRVVIDVGERKWNDLDVLATVAQDLFGAEPHWGEYVKQRGEPGGLVGDIEPAPIRRLYWEAAPLTSFMAENGFTFGVKSPRRRIPPGVMSGSKQRMLGFISGLISTDGSIYFDAEANVRAELATTSDGLAGDVQQLFALLGARTSRDVRPNEDHHPLHRVIFRGREALNVLRRAALVNRFKAERLGALGEGAPARSRSTRIVAIEDDRLEVPVYDLSVEGDLQEFTAGGLIVHNCPTWDLPAGGLGVGGTCPGADQGQTVIDPSIRRKRLVSGEELLTRFANDPRASVIQAGLARGQKWWLTETAPGSGDPVPMVEGGTICSQCYAFEGNYPSPHVQLGEVLRYWWVRSMLEQDRMTELVDTVLLSMRLIRYSETPYGILPVRVHSAGDFFSQQYARMWLNVADELWRMGGNAKRVKMWAPTRTWASGHWKDFWAAELPKLLSARDGTPNLIVRPSAYNFNDAAPGALARGNGTGSTSLLQHEDARRFEQADAQKLATNDPRRFHAPAGETRYDWACPTYALEQEKHTCANATGPDGRPHCRVCWVHPEWRVHYTAH